MPRVSICIPSYKPKHFRICLTSAVAQTFDDIEILVSDDCPTEEIREICDQFPMVKYSRNPNKGGRNNLIRLMSMAQGEYIKFILDDDVLHPFCVQYMYQTFQGSGEANVRLVYSPRGTIDANNNLTGVINQLNITGPGASLLKGPQVIGIIASNCVNFIGEFSSVMFRKEDVDRLVGRTLLDLPEANSRALGDVIAWVNLAREGNIAVHPETLTYFRQHTGTNSDPASNPEFVLNIIEWEMIVEHARNNGYLQPAQQHQAYESLLRIFNAWVGPYPELAEGIQRVQQRMIGLAA